MNEYEQEIVEQKVRRAVGISVLRKIGDIVAEEQKIDTDKARALRWFIRYGWIVLPCFALLVAYTMGLI